MEQRVAAAVAQHRRFVAREREHGRPVATLTALEIRARELALMRRENARQSLRAGSASLEGSLQAREDIVFGTPAIDRHLADPESGFFVKSPKSFIGSDVSAQHQLRFTEIVTRMLANTKQLAEARLDVELTRVVLGRPVNFTTARAEEGNLQATRILETAALGAGFDQVAFLQEPIAAALAFERTLDGECIALVVDAGAGTTDCSMLRLDPAAQLSADRDDDILGCSGTRVGGIDIDIKLAMRCVMPLFGLGGRYADGLPIPNSVFWNAVAINDVNAQATFFSPRGKSDVSVILTRAVDRERVTRLARLHDRRLSYRLNRTSETAKIALSTLDDADVPLEYIEPTLRAAVTRDQLKAAVTQELERFRTLMRDVVAQSQQTPSIVYVTGGTAGSPLVRDVIRSEFPDTDIVAGDAFGSVASGLTIRAHQLFR